MVQGGMGERLFFACAFSSAFLGVSASADLCAAADAPLAPAAPTVAAGVREERVPIRGVRKHTAAAVSASAFTAPHVTEFLQIDITETMSAVERLKALPDFAEVRVSPLLVGIIIVGFGTSVPELIISLGGALDGATGLAHGNIVGSNIANILLVVALPAVIFPVVTKAPRMRATALAAPAQAHPDRPGRHPADSPAPITITNVGVFGWIRYPILTRARLPSSPSAGSGRRRGCTGQLAVRQVTTLALSFDHRSWTPPCALPCSPRSGPC
jgi:pyruvate dehydrogenase E2 component (dihydrolipoamide acetyltransferase)